MFKAIKNALAKLRPAPRQEEEIELSEFPATASPLVYIDAHFDIPALNLPPIDLSKLKSLLVTEYKIDFTGFNERLNERLNQQPQLNIQAIQRQFQLEIEPSQDIKRLLGTGF